MNIYIYGTGSGAKKFVESIEEYEDKINIKAFVDTNKNKIGTLFNGRPVISLNEFSLISQYDYLFIAAEFKEVYLKVLQRGIPESKVILVYAKIIDELFSVQLNKNIKVNERIFKYSKKKKLDIYVAYDNSRQENLKELRKSNLDFNILGFINDDNLVDIVNCKYDYIILATEDWHKYYKLLANGVKVDSIIPFKYKMMDDLYNNEIKKRNDSGIIYSIKTMKISLTLHDVKDAYNEINFDKVENPLVSIIVPVYNNWEYTYNCLYSIKNNVKGIKYEVVIADDNSIDETKHILRYIKNVVLVRNNSQLGFLKNCNKSSNYCKGKYIVFLNNDTYVQPNWLESFVSTMEKNKKIGLVGSKFVYPSGILQEAGGIVFKNGNGWNYGRMDDPSKPEYNYLKEVDYISGASIMINRELWQKLKGFDERFSPGYYDDSDLAFRVRKNGYKVIYQPQSVVVHFEGISHGTDIEKGIKSYQVKNRSKFVLKWKSELQDNNCDSIEEAFVARDRSKNKKTIVIIGENISESDKDAEGKTVFDYIKVLLKMNIKVIFISNNFLEKEPYITMLQQEGVEVLYGAYYRTFWKKWIIDNGKYIDSFWIYRPDGAIKYIKFIKDNTNSKIIYNAADLYFLREKRE